ncbi:TRAP transporter small permease subunit [Sneathiella chungangensis]|uniref:TRAP transporter small permease protein n=1 Tax=Sneathiella chungangensis TaxID=1418234 RepID=A0A845MFW9_9PROT|nr:TRAP transporter small permease subunit [Sneathiella chungangensis]MZR22739.1 TRAP transporter small permease subunit [Sneathiella chungangensis]
MLAYVKFFNRLGKGCGVFASVAVIILSLLMLLEVGLRYLAGAPTIWSYEVSYMLNGVAFVFGFSYVTLKNEHICVDFLSSRMPTKVNATINLLVTLALIFPLFCWLAFHVSADAIKFFEDGRTSGVSAWNPVIWPYKSLLAIGLIFAALQLFNSLVGLFLKVAFNSEIKE